MRRWARSSADRGKERTVVRSARKDGPDWREANIALQQIMQDYAGLVRTETMLTAGLSYVRRLRERSRARGTKPMGTDPLPRDEKSARPGRACTPFGQRTEGDARAAQRPDYPLTDPVLDGKAIFVRQVDGKPSMEWRKRSKNRRTPFKRLSVDAGRQKKSVFPLSRLPAYAL